MIEWFGTYIKTIVSFLLISVFAEMIMPEEYKKYLKLIMGLLLTIVVMQPVTYLFGFSEEQIVGIAQRKTQEVCGEDFYIETNGENDTLALEIYKEELNKKIAEDAQALRAEAVVEEDAQSDGYGNVISISIYSENEGDEEKDEKTAQYIGGKYGVSPKNIEFVYE